MHQDFHSAPIPVRLSCRYSNGTVVSIVARALSWDDPSLRVLSSETFEPGVQVSVLAPFLGGITLWRVLAASRSTDHPQYFELHLRMVKKPRPAKPAQAPAVPSHSGEMEEGPRAAEELASLLEGGGRFSEAIHGAEPDRLPLLLAIAGAAIALLLQEKGLTDLRRMLGRIHGRGST